MEDTFSEVAKAVSKYLRFILQSNNISCVPRLVTSM